MAEYKRAEIVTGLVIFFLVTLVVAGIFAFKLNGWQIPFFERPGVECEASFWDVKGMDATAKVTSGGHRIGTVIEILPDDREFTDDDVKEEKLRRENVPEDWRPGRRHHMVRVRFKITDPDFRLGDDPRAAIVQESFISAYHLQVDPGTWDKTHPPKLVRDRGDEAPIKLKSDRTDALQDVIQSMKPIIRQVDAMLGTIETKLLKPLLDDHAESVKKLIPDLEATLAEARKRIEEAKLLFDVKAPDSPVVHFNKLMDDTNVSVTDLKTKVTALIPTLEQAIKDGQSAMEAAKKTMVDASAVLDENRPNVKKFLADLKDESGRLKERLDDMQKRIATVLESVNEIAALRQSDVAVIIESFRNAAWEIENAARKVRANPAVVLFGDNEEKGLEADPRDDSGLRKSGRVKPYEKRDETPAKKE